MHKNVRCEKLEHFWGCFSDPAEGIKIKFLKTCSTLEISESRLNS